MYTGGGEDATGRAIAGRLAWLLAISRAEADHAALGRQEGRADEVTGLLEDNGRRRRVQRRLTDDNRCIERWA